MREPLRENKHTYRGDGGDRASYAADKTGQTV